MSSYDNHQALAGLTLGKSTDYRDTYDASLLQGVPRSLNRDPLGLHADNLPFHGADIWTLYELSWLNPLQLAEILGGGALIIFAQPDKQISFAVEHQPAAKMIADGELRLLAKDHGKVRQLRGILAQPPIAHRGARLTAGVAFRIAQPHPPRLGEIRGQRHVQ